MESFEEDLADFVRRLMNEKGLTTQDVEDRSGGRITAGYVRQILGRSARNLTVDKLKALAMGLGVPARQIGNVALGVAPENDEDFRTSMLYMLNEKMKGAPPEKRAGYEFWLNMIFRDLDQSA